MLRPRTSAPRSTPTGATARSWVGPLLALATLCGCGDEGSSGAASEAPVDYVGSSTIGEQIIRQAADRFASRTAIPFGNIASQGSGKGLELLLRGEAELAGVSRSLTPKEREQEIYYEIIGYDAIAVFVHPTNPVGSLTKKDLKAVYTGRIRNWKELGGADAEIVCVTQVWGAKRGQMVEFQEQVMDGAPYRDDRRECDLQTDEVAVVESEPNAIAAVSLAYARPSIKAVTIEGFAPERCHVRSGAYLLSRPLILVSHARPRNAVKRFLDFMLTREGQEIVAGKFVSVR